MNYFIAILLIYIAIIVTIAFASGFISLKKQVGKAPVKKNAVTVIDNIACFEKDAENKPVSKSSRVIALTDEYEYDQSKKYQNQNNR